MAKDTLNDRIAKLFQEGAWEKARKLLEVEQAKDPESHWLLTQRAAALYEQRKYEEALELLRASLKIVKDCPLTLWHMAGTLDALGKHSAAVRIYMWLLERETSSEEDPCWESKEWTAALKADSIYRLGLCFANMGKKHKAERYYRQYLDLLLLGVEGIYSLDDVTRRIQGIHNGRPRSGMARALRKVVRAALQASGHRAKAGRQMRPVPRQGGVLLGLSPVQLLSRVIPAVGPLFSVPSVRSDSYGRPENLLLSE